MRDDMVHALVGQVDQKIGQIVQFIQNLQQAVRLDSTGKEIRLLSLQRLLVSKGIVTEAEITDQAGIILKEMQEQAEAEAKKAAAPTIIPATPEQVTQVANTPVDAPVVPPQV